MGRIGRTHRICATIALALFLLVPRLAADVDRYEVYAVRFATIANFPSRA